MKQLNRRDLLKTGAGVAAGALLLPLRTAFAAVGQGEARLVVVLLRGALDGLSAVPPVGDPDYAALRRQIAVPASGAEGGALPLDGLLGLHPSLQFLAESWQQRQLTVLHAVATAYRERSHFDGQDVLESGHARPHAAQSGWLNRALTNLPGTQGREGGIALGNTVPLLMRGPAAVASWSPSKLAQLDDDTLQRIGDLYAGDGMLSRRLAEALSAETIAREAKEDAMSDPAGAAAAQGAAARQYLETVQAAAGFLRRHDGPRVAVFDTTGWDTHANEGAAQGQLAQRLKALDAGLRSLRDSLGPVWDHTAVLVATEFGRTAAVNGTGGTDHGTGAAAFVLGGAVRGGRVLADWPGLSASALYEGRDLRATMDLRSVCKTLLRDHLQIAQRHIDTQVFPDSKSAPYVADLVTGNSA
jgi:uncharacterized protein (DUF1501 family)